VMSIVHAEIMRETIRRLLLIKSLDDYDFFFELCERLLFPTGLISAPDIPTIHSAYFERSAKDTLLPP